MRTFDLKERLHTSLDTIPYFMDAEFRYYSQNNVRKFVSLGPSGGRPVSYNSLYRRLNVQLVVTNACPFDCPFCIEKVNLTNNNEKFYSGKQKQALRDILLTLHENGMEPTVSITGGEPTIFLDHILDIAKMLDKMGVPYNLNTSGSCTDSRLKAFERINLSVHSSRETENDAVFGSSRGEYWKEDIFSGATIQKVITDDNLEKLTCFLDGFKNKRFSIRFPARTEFDPSFDWKPLFDRILCDERFSFIQQKIGDYYFFEEWKYKDKTIRFSFADMTQLSYYKQRKEDECNYVRAVVVMADGSVKFDWLNQ